MPAQLIFIPVLFQIFIVIALYLRLGKVKDQAVANGEVNEARRSLHDDAWPDGVLQVKNAINNQFEAPVLFYVLILVLWSIQSIDIFTHVIAWLFVISRAVHAYVHVGSNYVPHRRRTFVIGVVSLLTLLIYAGYLIVVSAL